MSTLTEQARVGEVVKWFTDRGYCLESRIIEGGAAVSGAAGAIYVGELLRLGTGTDLIAISASTGADCIAVGMEDVSLEENTAGDKEILCLVRGPALIDGDNVVTTESDTQKTQALAALAVLLIRESSSGDVTWSTQTT